VSVRDFHFLLVVYLVSDCCVRLRVRVSTVPSPFRLPILARYSWICPDNHSLFLSLVTVSFTIPSFRYYLLTVFFPMALLPNDAMASSFLRFLDHTQRRTTVGMTPLDKWSARRRGLYLTTHNTHNRQTCIPPVGLEPTIPASERPQTDALDRAASEIGRLLTAVVNRDRFALSVLILHYKSDYAPCICMAPVILLWYVLPFEMRLQCIRWPLT
jgi:hypothetical protein